MAVLLSLHNRFIQVIFWTYYCKQALVCLSLTDVGLVLVRAAEWSFAPTRPEDNMFGKKKPAPEKSSLLYQRRTVFQM